MATKPVIRRATADDADFIVWTILAAQRGHRPRGWFDCALNIDEPRRLDFIRRVATASVNSQWHVSCFWIAELDGRPAAALCALPIGEARTTTRPAIVEAANSIGATDADFANVSRTSALFGRCWTWGDDGNWMIEHVATRPAYRGRALFPALLTHALEEGQAKGFRRASIGFYIGNDLAERSYAKAGFSFAEEKRDPEFETLTGAPGFRRFERTI